MSPWQVPQELLDMLDKDAGKRHSREGPVVASLARILTRHEEMLLEEVEDHPERFVWNG